MLDSFIHGEGGASNERVGNRKFYKISVGKFGMKGPV
jgi:hypothetical protein